MQIAGVMSPCTAAIKSICHYHFVYAMACVHCTARDHISLSGLDVAGVPRSIANEQIGYRACMCLGSVGKPDDERGVIDGMLVIMQTDDEMGLNARCGNGLSLNPVYLLHFSV